MFSALLSTLGVTATQFAEGALLAVSVYLMSRRDQER